MPPITRSMVKSHGTVHIIQEDIVDRVWIEGPAQSGTAGMPPESHHDSPCRTHHQSAQRRKSPGQDCFSQGVCLSLPLTDNDPDDEEPVYPSGWEDACSEDAGGADPQGWASDKACPGPENTEMRFQFTHPLVIERPGTYLYEVYVKAAGENTALGWLNSQKITIKAPVERLESLDTTEYPQRLKCFPEVKIASSVHGYINEVLVPWCQVVVIGLTTVTPFDHQFAKSVIKSAFASAALYRVIPNKDMRPVENWTAEASASPRHETNGNEWMFTFNDLTIPEPGEYQMEVIVRSPCVDRIIHRVLSRKFTVSEKPISAAM